VRRNQAKVGLDERTTERWLCTVGGDVNRQKPTLLTESTANDTGSSVHVGCIKQAFDAHARALLQHFRGRRRTLRHVCPTQKRIKVDSRRRGLTQVDRRQKREIGREDR
jgi:hypothetical protein